MVFGTDLVVDLLQPVNRLFSSLATAINFLHTVNLIFHSLVKFYYIRATNEHSFYLMRARVLSRRRVAVAGQRVIQTNQNSSVSISVDFGFKNCIVESENEGININNYWLKHKWFHLQSDIYSYST